MKRWLLWTFFCLRGRRCANLVVDDFESDAPPGSILRLGYECHGCGTVYESSFLVGTGNALVATGRERLTFDRMLDILACVDEADEVGWDPNPFLAHDLRVRVGGRVYVFAVRRPE